MACVFLVLVERKINVSSKKLSDIINHSCDRKFKREIKFATNNVRVLSAQKNFLKQKRWSEIV